MNLFRHFALTVALVATFVLGAVAVTPAADAAPRNQTANVGQLVSGLINVNIGAVQLAIETGDITLVNVENVLNDNQIEILNNVLNNSPILSNNSNILNNLLNNGQVVVGVLSGGILVVR